jgi:hypothetical protein
MAGGVETTKIHPGWVQSKPQDRFEWSLRQIHFGHFSAITRAPHTPPLPLSVALHALTYAAALPINPFNPLTRPLSGSAMLWQPRP